MVTIRFWRNLKKLERYLSRTPMILSLCSGHKVVKSASESIQLRTTKNFTRTFCGEFYTWNNLRQIKFSELIRFSREKYEKSKFEIHPTKNWLAPQERRRDVPGMFPATFGNFSTFKTG